MNDAQKAANLFHDMGLELVPENAEKALWAIMQLACVFPAQVMWIYWSNGTALRVDPEGQQILTMGPIRLR